MLANAPLFLFAVSFVCFAFPSACFAYRPFSTEDAGVAEKHAAQLEASWDHTSWKNGDREHTFLIVPIYGITERIELSGEFSYHFHNPAEGEKVNGPGDIALVGKFLVLEEKALRPALVLKSSIKTNSGNKGKGLGTGENDFGVAAAASKCIGGLLLHLMAGYTFVGDNGDVDIYLYGVAGDYGFNGRFHIVGELAGNRPPDRNVDGEMICGLLGVLCTLSKNVVLDAGVRRGFNDLSPRWSITMGLSIVF